MSMGTTPEVLVCAHGGFIIAVIRREGTVFAYDFSNEELVLLGKSRLGQYVVDTSIRAGSEEGAVELILLLCETDDSKDGRICEVKISGKGETNIYLSSI